MAKSALSGILAGGLMLCGGLHTASAGIFSFFHHSNCEECCRQNECECEEEEEEPEKEHCCCFCPPCPPEGLFAYSVVPLELAGMAALPQNAQPQKDQPQAPDAAKAAPTPPVCTLEEVCRRQNKMDEELIKLDKDLTELTISVKELTKTVKGMKQPAAKPAVPPAAKK